MSKFGLSLICRALSGPIHRPVDRAGVPGGVHGVPEGQRYRGPLLRQGNGLPGGAEFAGDLRR